MACLSLIPPVDEPSLSFQVLDETALGPAERRQHVHVPPELLGQIEADADDLEGVLAVDLEEQVDVGRVLLLAADERAEHAGLSHRWVGAEYLADDSPGLGVVLDGICRIIAILYEIFQSGTFLNGERGSGLP